MMEDTHLLGDEQYRYCTAREDRGAVQGATRRWTEREREAVLKSLYNTGGLPVSLGGTSGVEGIIKKKKTANGKKKKK